MANSANLKIYEIFLSCERKNEPLCVKLCQKLAKQLGLKIWTIAINAKLVDKPLPLVKKAINSSQIFVCGLTVKYTETKECIDEIMMAKEIGLPGIIILLEPTVPHNFPGLVFTSSWPKINMYEDPQELAKWTGPNYDFLVEKIMELLNRPVPGKEKSELDIMFHEMQSTVDKSYEKNWKKLESLPIKEDVPLSMEIQQNGCMNLGNLKNEKMNKINNHIANFPLLKSKLTNSTQNEEFKKFNSLIKFCFQFLGKSALDCLNKEVDGYFTVKNSNPVCIEFKKSQQNCSVEEILTKFFKHIANSTWTQLGIRAKKVIVTCPADYGMLEKGDLKNLLLNAGLDLMQIVSIPISEALALNERNQKLERESEQEANKNILIDWKTGAVSVTAYETIPNKPMQLLNSFSDTNLTNRMLEKEQMSLIKSKLKDPKEIDLTEEMAERAFLEAFLQFKKGNKIAKIKLSKSNEIEISSKEMLKLCRSFVERSAELFNAILNERDLKITDFKRVHFCCPLPYSILAESIYDVLYSDSKLDKNFFIFEENLDTLQAITNMADRKIRGKASSVSIPLDYNLGVRDYSGLFDVFLKRGLSLPTEATKTYTTIRDNQTSISLRIYSGERPMCRYCDFLGQLVVTDLPKKRAREVQLLVTFKIDESGLLSVDAKEATQDKYFKTSIDRSNMKKQKLTGITEKQKYEKEDTELASKTKYATIEISKLQVKYRGNETYESKIENWIDYLEKHSDTIDIESINMIIKEINQLII